MSERGGGERTQSNKNKHTHTHTHTRACFFFVAPRALCNFLEKDRGFADKNIGCNVFYRRHRVFLYKTYEYLHFSKTSRFFLKNPTTNASFSREKQKTRRTKKKKKHGEQTNTRSKKKYTLTWSFLSCLQYTPAEGLRIPATRCVFLGSVTVLLFLETGLPKYYFFMRGPVRPLASALNPKS